MALTECHKFVAFDIETTKCDGPMADPEKVGVTCVAAVASKGAPGDSPDISVWFAEGPSKEGMYAAQMPPKQIQEVLAYLYGLLREGYIPVTWNGLRFDFCALAANAHDKIAREWAIKMALNHIDIMFDVFCVKGFPVGLNNAADGLGVGSKLKGMSGSLAPDLWERDRESQDLVLQYVRQDAILTAKVLLAVYKRGWFQWRSSSGKIRQAALPRRDNRLLTVAEALHLSEPDTSWMDKPMTRESFYEWTLPEDQRPQKEVTDIPALMQTLVLEIAKSWEAAVAALVYAVLLKTSAEGQLAHQVLESLQAHWAQKMPTDMDEIIQGIATHADDQD